MKKFSAFIVACVCHSFVVVGQINEDFEPVNNASPLSALSASCWQFSNINWSNGNILNNTGSVYIGPITNGRETGSISTPFLITGGSSVTISFTYAVRNKLNNPATRTIQIGYTDKQGVFTQLDIIVINSNSPAGAQTFSRTFTNVPIGTYRFTFVLSGNADGNTNLYFDKLSINAAKYYPSGCNTAPVAQNDNFSSLLIGTLTGNILSNDTDPEGEKITPTILQSPQTGLLSLNEDGSFKFTPSLNFIGGPVSFTYLVTDNGYAPLASKVATVTMQYPLGNLSAPIPITLPIQLKHFSGNVVQNKTSLKWQVEENEAGDVFEVQKSRDGKTFKTIGLVFASEVHGKETYNFQEQHHLQHTSFYRLNIVNKNKESSYSKVVTIEKPTSGKNHAYIYQNTVLSGSVLQYTAEDDGVIVLNIYNTNGWLRSLKQPVKKGGNSINLDLGMKNKVYWIELLAGENRLVIKSSH